MTKKRKTPGSAATLTGAAETATGQAAISISDFTTPSGTRQPLRVSDFLLVGAENAQPMKHLRAIINSDSRTIRKRIELERRSGTPILASESGANRGYYLAGNRGEIERFCHSMRKRGREILKTAAIVQLSEPEANNGG